MSTWLVTFSNGARVQVEAYSAAEAKREAERQADRDGFPGLSAISAKSENAH